ncbi:MAG: hypothetical protein ACE5JG_04000, partial [Planctomycetota bacterium]
NYLAAQVDRVGSALAEGLTPEQAARSVSFPEVASFRQYPQYGATWRDNAAAVARELAARPAPRGRTAGFRVLARIHAGDNPHQIAFSPDGRTAYIAAAGSDRVTLVETRSRRVAGTLPVRGVPLGLAVPPPGRHLLVSLFGADRILRLALAGEAPARHLVTGRAPSLLVGPLPGRRYLVSAERRDRLWVLDADRFALEQDYPTGARPFPPSATSDGRLAFVPNHDDGTATVVDLWNRRVVDTVTVGGHPCGGAVLPGDVLYAVAVRGEDRIAFINTASHRVVDTLADGIGKSPFSVVVSPGGRLAFINNTASHDISVLALPRRRVVARLPVGAIPIVMAVHPSGETLWVSSEGSHEVTVIEIPPRWRQAPDSADRQDAAGRPTEVAVLGMIHARHRTSRAWGLDQVRETIRRLAPDVVCAEIPPDRWDRIWSDYAERSVIEDERILRFPEYTQVLLPLAVEMGFEIVPCAAWTKEMSDLRRSRLEQFDTDPAWAERKRRYEHELARVRAGHERSLDAIDDPRFIHSEAYDLWTRQELSLYDRYLNDWIGPGGWTHINEAHMRLIDRALRQHRGRRVLITFGAGHKYWFLERLRARDDVRQLDVGPFLPAGAPSGGRAGADQTINMASP